MNPLSSILQSCNKDRPLNILTAPTHERYETGLAKTGHNFFAIRYPGVKDWDSVYAPTPPNYHLLKEVDNMDEVAGTLRPEAPIDLVLSQNKFGQYQILKQFASLLNVPLISLEHTLPLTFYEGRKSMGWSTEQLNQLREMRGDVNVFISEMSKNTWLYDYSSNNVVIEHGVDSELFKPSDVKRKNTCLSVVNDWINRDVFCGYKIWKDVIEGFSAYVLGNTPGLSEPAKTTQELVKAYQTHSVFINTSQISPIPSSLLEAMACECAVITTATCMIPEVIKNGFNGFISNDISYLRGKTKFLLENPDKAREMGRNARKTVLDRFAMDNFVNNWNNLFRRVT